VTLKTAFEASPIPLWSALMPFAALDFRIVEHWRPGFLVEPRLIPNPCLSACYDLALRFS
jgi:hypothetical protein